MIIENVTDTSGDYDFPTPGGGTVSGIKLYVADMPGIGTIEWLPGQIIDLTEIATDLQIESSRHLKVHITEGRMEVV